MKSSGSQIKVLLENSNVRVDDYVLVVIFSMLTTSGLLKAMVLTCFHSPLPLSLFKIVCKKWLFIIQHERVVWEHNTIRAPIQPERFQQMLCSLANKNCFVQQLDVSGVRDRKHMTGNKIGESGADSIGRALKLNTSITSLNVSCVVLFKQLFTQQITILVILVLIALGEHSS